MQRWEATQVRTLGWALLAFAFVWALLNVALRATSFVVLEGDGSNVTMFGLGYLDAIRLYSYLAAGFALTGVGAIAWAVALERHEDDEEPSAE